MKNVLIVLIVLFSANYLFAGEPNTLPEKSVITEEYKKAVEVQNAAIAKEKAIKDAVAAALKAIEEKEKKKSEYEKAYDKHTTKQYWYNKMEIDNEKHQGNIRMMRAHYDYKIYTKYNRNRYNYRYRRTYRRGCRRDFSPRMYSVRACP